MWVWSTTYTKSILPNSLVYEKFITNFKDFWDRILIFLAARLLRLQSSLCYTQVEWVSWDFDVPEVSALVTTSQLFSANDSNIAEIPAKCSISNILSCLCQWVSVGFNF